MESPLNCLCFSGLLPWYTAALVSPLDLGSAAWVVGALGEQVFTGLWVLGWHGLAGRSAPGFYVMPKIRLLEEGCVS